LSLRLVSKSSSNILFVYEPTVLNFRKWWVNSEYGLCSSAEIQEMLDVVICLMMAYWQGNWCTDREICSPTGKFSISVAFVLSEYSYRWTDKEIDFPISLSVFCISLLISYTKREILVSSSAIYQKVLPRLASQFLSTYILTPSIYVL